MSRPATGTKRKSAWAIRSGLVVQQNLGGSRRIGGREGVVTDVIDRMTMPVFQVVHQPVWNHDAATAHLARELHDGVAGELATALLDLERFKATQVGRLGVLTEITHLQDQLRFVLSNVRQLLNDQRGLPGVERNFVTTFRHGFARRFSERTGLLVRVSEGRSWPSELPKETALNLHRILQEALNNVDRHSGARSVRIRFDAPTGGASGVVTITDDGRGYGQVAEDWKAGMGLVGIEERALLLGARVTVSNGTRGGSTLTVTVPRRSLGL